MIESLGSDARQRAADRMNRGLLPQTEDAPARRKPEGITLFEADNTAQTLEKEGEVQKLYGELRLLEKALKNPKLTDKENRELHAQIDRITARLTELNVTIEEAKQRAEADDPEVELIVEKLAA